MKKKKKRKEKRELLPRGEKYRGCAACVTGNRNVKNIFQRELRNVSLHISHSPDEAYTTSISFCYALLPTIRHSSETLMQGIIRLSKSAGPVLSCKFNARRGGIHIWTAYSWTNYSPPLFIGDAVLKSGRVFRG